MNDINTHSLLIILTNFTHYFIFQGIFSLLGALALSIASLKVQPPPRYPDIWPVLISAYACAHFAFFFVYFTYWQCFSETEDIDRPEVGTKKKGIKKGDQKVSSKAGGQQMKLSASGDMSPGHKSRHAKKVQ